MSVRGPGDWSTVQCYLARKGKSRLDAGYDEAGISSQISFQAEMKLYCGAGLTNLAERFMYGRRIYWHAYPTMHTLTPSTAARSDWWWCT